LHHHVHGRQHASRALQSDGWNRFVAGRATCSVDDQVGDATCGQEVDFGWGSAPEPAGGAYDAPPNLLVGWGVGWGGGYPLPIPYPLGAYGASTLGASLLTPSAFGCLTEAKAHPTSSFWRRHCEHAFVGMFSSRVISVLDSGAVRPGFNSQP